MSREEYSKAHRLGEKAFQLSQNKGMYPYLPILEDVIGDTVVKSRVALGVVTVPLENVVGTASRGRTVSFAGNFMPLLGPETEFAVKWATLYVSMLETGMREPIIAIEYMNKYYVVEGNKRTSVLKYTGAVSVEASVTRYIPERTDEKENRIYYEYLEFYSKTGINFIWFSQEGGFRHLIRLVRKRPREVWNDEERHAFQAAYYRFAGEYRQMGGEKLDLTVGDAFLLYLEVYGYEQLREKSMYDMRRDLAAIWDEYLVKANSEGAMAFIMEPTETKTALRARLLLTQPQTLKIAFLHQKNTRTSGWTLSHEIGREELDRIFGSKIETTCREDVTAAGFESTVRELADSGFKTIFVTSPVFLHECIQAAVAVPDARIINCSLHPAYKRVLTYYLRIYEAKFLLGLIAGAMAENDRVGYVADYPICGITAGINAFAIGAKMVNPRVKVFLEWSTLRDRDMDSVRDAMRQNGVHVICNRDLNAPIRASREFGLYRMDDGADEPVNLAAPEFRWGRFYEFLIRKIQNGTWNSEAAAGDNQALSYWWGMSADAVDVVYSERIPTDVQRMVSLFHREIQAGTFRVFGGMLRSQEGIVQSDPDMNLPPLEIITMNWLADNVIGRIPDIGELVPDAHPVVRAQGVKNRVLINEIVSSANFPDLEPYMV